jgi:hypothetical protein
MTSKVYKDGKVHAVAYKCTWKWILEYVLNMPIYIEKLPL